MAELEFSLDPRQKFSCLCGRAGCPEEPDVVPKSSSWMVRGAGQGSHPAHPAGSAAEEEPGVQRGGLTPAAPRSVPWLVQQLLSVKCVDEPH